MRRGGGCRDFGLNYTAQCLQTKVIGKNFGIHFTTKVSGFILHTFLNFGQSFSLWVVLFTYCENLALFKVASIHRIRKSTKNRNSETRWKLTEDSRLRLQGSNRPKDREMELINNKA